MRRSKLLEQVPRMDFGQRPPITNLLLLLPRFPALALQQRIELSICVDMIDSVMSIFQGVVVLLLSRHLGIVV